MDYSSVRIYPVPRLGSRWATACILLVHDHRALSLAGKRRGIGCVALGVDRCIALGSGRSLGLNNSTCDHTAHLGGKLAALKGLADRGAAFHVFGASLHGLVIGMIAAESICSVAILVSGIIDHLGMDRPETLFQFR